MDDSLLPSFSRWFALSSATFSKFSNSSEIKIIISRIASRRRLSFSFSRASTKAKTGRRRRKNRNESTKLRFLGRQKRGKRRNGPKVSHSVQCEDDSATYDWLIWINKGKIWLKSAGILSDVETKRKYTQKRALQTWRARSCVSLRPQIIRCVFFQLLLWLINRSTERGQEINLFQFTAWSLSIDAYFTAFCQNVGAPATSSASFAHRKTKWYAIFLCSGSDESESAIICDHRTKIIIESRTMRPLAV